MCEGWNRRDYQNRRLDGILMAERREETPRKHDCMGTRRHEGGKHFREPNGG
jgi:hypothetical protein